MNDKEIHEMTKLQAIHKEIGVELVKASSIELKPIKWIWKGWLASGKFHLLGGEAGTGKSTIAMWLCAIISSGGLFPDGQRAEQGDVVIWSGEDDIEDTLAPRLKVMGADLNRVHFVRGFHNGNSDRPFDPKSDMQSLREKISEMSNVKLLVIDPIVSTIKNDSNSNSNVRNDLTPISDMASELDFGLLGITHFSKGTFGKLPLERITGSLAFGAIPRVVWAVAKTKDEIESGTRILVRIKSNIGKDGDGFRYQIQQAIDSDIETCKVHWGEPIFGTPSDLFQEAEYNLDVSSTKTDDCCKFIEKLLADGPMPTNEIQSILKEAGYSDATQRRAKDRLKIKAYRSGGFADKGEWNWTKLSKVDPSQNMSILGQDRQLREGNWIEREV